VNSVFVFATLKDAVLVPELPDDPEFVALSVSVLLGQNQLFPAVELLEHVGMVESTKK
jgi:hypothetical protein